MRTRLVAALALALVLTAACGPSGGGPGVASVGGNASAGPSASAGATRNLRAWAQCMRTNGIPVPDPDPVTGQLAGFDKGSQDRDKFTRASAACAALEPVRPDSNKDPLTPAELEQARKWTTCMRDNGVPVPDPDPNDPNGPNFGRLPNMPPPPAIDNALHACQSLLPRSGGQ